MMILAGIFNAAMDVLKVRFEISVFKKWKNQNWIDPSIAWHNKWKLDEKIFGKQINIIDKIMSTVLVWVTDMWHFMKMLMLLCISIAIVFYEPIFNWWLDVIIMYGSFTITFELFFSRIFVKR